MYEATQHAGVEKASINVRERDIRERSYLQHKYTSEGASANLIVDEDDGIHSSLLLSDLFVRLMVSISDFSNDKIL